MVGGRPKEVRRKYIHTSLSQPVYDRMEDVLIKEGGGKIRPGAMRDFIEDCVELMFMELDKEEATKREADKLKY